MHRDISEQWYESGCWCKRQSHKQRHNEVRIYSEYILSSTSLNQLVEFFNVTHCALLVSRK